MQQQQQQPQFPPGHAANIAPPTPPPPPAGFDSNNPLDSAPGIAMEYKVHVEAGKEDCYWQYVHKGATLYVSYQVLKGGDGAIGMAVRNPTTKVVHPYAWKASSEYEESDVPTGGYYSVCLDNQFSRFSAKLVNLYLTTFRYDEWEKFSQELQDMDVTVENFTGTLRSVDQRVQVRLPVKIKEILRDNIQLFLDHETVPVNDQRSRVEGFKFDCWKREIRSDLVHHSDCNCYHLHHSPGMSEEEE